MNLGLGVILLIVAVVLFLLSAVSDSSTDYISWGLAAFAGSFLAGAVGWGDRSLGNRRT